MPSELAEALASVQENLPEVAKGATASIPGKEGRQGYSYDYADLADVSAAIMPLLGKNGLAFTAWPTLSDDGRFVLAYALIHKSGEERTGVYPLPSSGRPQDIGGAITYARRYCLCAVTGVAPGGEDDDAAGVTEVHMDRARPQARPPSDVPTTARPVRIKTPGPEHEQIRHGTVEWAPEDRPTEHGPLPDDQNPWQDVPPEQQPGSADPKDVKGIQIAYSKLGFDHRTDRSQLLSISEQIINRQLTGPNQGRTHNNLTYPEARKLRDTLQSFGGDRGALMERLTGITRAVAAVASQDAAESSQDDSPEVPT
jgi:ERF superfamily